MLSRGSRMLDPRALPQPDPIAVIRGDGVEPRAASTPAVVRSATPERDRRRRRRGVREREPVAEREGGAERERGVRVAHGVADRLDAHGDGLPSTTSERCTLWRLPIGRTEVIGWEQSAWIHGTSAGIATAAAMKAASYRSARSSRSRAAIMSTKSERPVVPQEHDEDEYPVSPRGPRRSDGRVGSSTPGRNRKCRL